MAVLLTLSSCKNIEKMVDKGNYNEAISYAVGKLQGQKNKKTKYVRALEKSYAKVNTYDINRIQSLLASDNVARYDKIHDIYNDMLHRQNTVSRLDPLISEDGYIATFNHTDYNELLTTTAAHAAEAHYNEAKRLLTVAIDHDKYAARSAYRQLGFIERYYSHYKDVDALYRKAYDIGMDHVAVSVATTDLHPDAHLLSSALFDIDVSSLNDFWTTFHLGGSADILYDYTATIQLTTIDPGYEREYFNTYIDSRNIEDGTAAVLDLNGNVVHDTLGNIVYQKSYRTIEANVTELIREKSATITGRTIVYDNNSNSLVKSIPLQVTYQFDDYRAHYTGDDRALSNASKKKLKATCNNFPSDYDMILAMTYDFKDAAYSILAKDIR